MELGPGALMAKFDVEAAYRNMPIHESECYLLGMQWHDQYYVDLTLLFGLRSTSYIFDSVAAMVEWILRSNYHFRLLGRFHHSRPWGLPEVRSQCYHPSGSVWVFGSSPPSRQVHGSHDVSRFSGR